MIFLYTPNGSVLIEVSADPEIEDTTWTLVILGAYSNPKTAAESYINFSRYCSGGILISTLSNCLPLFIHTVTDQRKDDENA